MNWIYDEDGCYTKKELTKFQFWINKIKCGAYLDWRVTHDGQVYGGQFFLNTAEHIESLFSGELSDDVIGFLDSLEEGCLNQVKLKLSESLDQSEDFENSVSDSEY